MIFLSLIFKENIFYMYNFLSQTNGMEEGTNEKFGVK